MTGIQKNCIYWQQRIGNWDFKSIICNSFENYETVKDESNKICKTFMLHIIQQC